MTTPAADDAARRAMVSLAFAGGRAMATDWVRFTSSLGMSIVAPDDWTAEEDRHAFTLHAPDGHAVINVFRYDADPDSEGFDSQMFESTAVAGVIKKRKSWKPLETGAIDIRYRPVTRRDFVPDPDDEIRWRLYTYTADAFHYAILLEAATTALSSNGERYERIVRTFKGAEES